ncbi:Spy0128 family protein, partial [Slackia exigua]
PDTFSFVLKRTDASFPMPAGSDGDTKTITVEGAGSSEFGDIEFTLPGTYTYTITETKGGAACTYDGSSYALTYEVTDDGQGKLQAKRSMTKTVDGTTTAVDLGAQGDAVGAVFTNVYSEPADPEQPTNPTNPTEQAKPQKPLAPSTPAGDSAATSETSDAPAAKALPRTGDGTLPYVLVVLASLSAGAVLVGTEMKRRMA